MIAAQLIACHNASMEFYRRAMIQTDCDVIAPSGEGGLAVPLPGDHAIRSSA
jgi:hypothetical protein